MSVLMWEAKAAPGRVADLVEFARANADPTAQVYASADDRVVVIDPTGHGMPDVAAELVARAPHVWPFEQIERVEQVER